MDRQRPFSIIPLSARSTDAADLARHPAGPLAWASSTATRATRAITPGLVRFTSPAQAAGYFMLGETTKTSAAGKERGKTRSPFTQPFFPAHHGLQATRFAEILKSTHEITTWMMNTGYIGGLASEDRTLNVKIRHSSAMLEALFRDQVVWVRDPDFGYEVVDLDAPENAALIEAVGADILRPDHFYARTGRSEEYRAEVAQRHADRAAFLASYDVDQNIVSAVIQNRG